MNLVCWNFLRRLWCPLACRAAQNPPVNTTSASSKTSVSSLLDGLGFFFFFQFINPTTFRPCPPPSPSLAPTRQRKDPPHFFPMSSALRRTTPLAKRSEKRKRIVSQRVNRHRSVTLSCTSEAPHHQVMNKTARWDQQPHQGIIHSLPEFSLTTELLCFWVIFFLCFYAEYFFFQIFLINLFSPSSESIKNSCIQDTVLSLSHIDGVVEPGMEHVLGISMRHTITTQVLAGWWIIMIIHKVN